MEKIAAVLISAHAIADFILQTDKLIQRKNQPVYLMFHAGVHAILSYVVLQSWTCWPVPLFIFVIHSLIDFGKHRSNSETATTFAIDQLIHVSSLIGFSWVLVYFSWCPEFTGIGYNVLILSAGFITTVQGANFLIDKVTKRIIKENKLKMKGLDNAGEMIGKLERSLIFLFVFIGQPAGIGFLLVAKSIFGFGEKRDKKLIEYFLIGTFLSFFLAIAISYITMWAMKF